MGNGAARPGGGAAPCRAVPVVRLLDGTLSVALPAGVRDCTLSDLALALPDPRVWERARAVRLAIPAGVRLAACPAVGPPLLGPRVAALDVAAPRYAGAIEDVYCLLARCAAGARIVRLALDLSAGADADAAARPAAPAPAPPPPVLDGVAHLLLDVRGRRWGAAELAGVVAAAFPRLRTLLVLQTAEGAAAWRDAVERAYGAGAARPQTTVAAADGGGAAAGADWFRAVDLPAAAAAAAAWGRPPAPAAAAAPAAWVRQWRAAFGAPARAPGAGARALALPDPRPEDAGFARAFADPAFTGWGGDGGRLERVELRLAPTSAVSADDWRALLGAEAVPRLAVIGAPSPAAGRALADAVRALSAAGGRRLPHLEFDTDGAAAAAHLLGACADAPGLRRWPGLTLGRGVDARALTPPAVTVRTAVPAAVDLYPPPTGTAADAALWACHRSVRPGARKKGGGGGSRATQIVQNGRRGCTTFRG